MAEPPVPAPEAAGVPRRHQAGTRPADRAAPAFVAEDGSVPDFVAEDGSVPDSEDAPGTLARVARAR
ncbi:hypothetical protein [Streptomyces wuyuanensis]|uniref:hypothetical protein n=1 Tax=Streptomyces wuyuanensis TaxID=1196353 RepID=UPI003420C846